MQWRKIKSITGISLIITTFIVGLIPLFLIIGSVIQKGHGAINWHFFVENPVPVGEVGGGMAHAILGTLYMSILGSCIAIPLGLICGIFISEYKTPLSRTLKYAIDLFVGIPSIVIGIFAYLLIVVPLKSFSALAGAIALSLIMFPIITRSSEEILRLIPNHIREAGLALGLPRWKIIFFIVLRGVRSSLLTGIILGLSRAIGETAPLLFTAFGQQYISMKLGEPMASLPVQIYNYAISPFPDWQQKAWGGSLILICIVLGLSISARLFVKRTHL